MLLYIFAFLMWSTQLTAEEVGINLESDLISVFSGDLGYTLVGAKPVSVEQSLSWSLCSDQERMSRLFESLKKIFAKSNNFIFKVLHTGGYVELINKRALLSQIRANKNLNNFVVKKYKSVNRFLEELCNEEICIFDAVDHDPVLIAIVLGYGEDNGRFFVRRIEVGEYLQKYPVVAFFPFDQMPGPHWAFPKNEMYFMGPMKINKVTPSSGFLSLEQEWEHIKAVEKKCDESIPKIPYYISLPVYVSGGGAESDAIHEDFLRSQEKLAQLFCDKKPSEVIADLSSL